jgi:hypothetical protein
MPSANDDFLAAYRSVVAMLPDSWEVGVKSMSTPLSQKPDQAVRFRALAENARENETMVVYGPTELAAIIKLRDALATSRFVSRK